MCLFKIHMDEASSILDPIHEKNPYSSLGV